MKKNKFELKPLEQIVNKQTGMSSEKDIINDIKLVTQRETTYIFLEIKIQDGERSHNHRVVFQTKCKNIHFAVVYHICHYWGFSWRDQDVVFAHGGEIALKLSKYRILTIEEYNTLYKIFY